MSRAFTARTFQVRIETPKHEPQVHLRRLAQCAGGTSWQAARALNGPERSTHPQHCESRTLRPTILGVDELSETLQHLTTSRLPLPFKGAADAGKPKRLRAVCITTATSCNKRKKAFRIVTRREQGITLSLMKTMSRVSLFRACYTETGTVDSTVWEDLGTRLSSTSALAAFRVTLTPKTLNPKCWFKTCASRFRFSSSIAEYWTFWV